MTPTIRREAAMMGWTLADEGTGYHSVGGLPYPSYLLEIDRVSDNERDDLLALFGHATMMSIESGQWWRAHTVERSGVVALSELEEYNEIVEKFLAHLPLEMRFLGLSEEERQRAAILLLPNDALRALSPEFVKSLPEEVQAEIRKRLSH